MTKTIKQSSKLLQITTTSNELNQTPSNVKITNVLHLNQNSVILVQ